MWALFPNVKSLTIGEGRYWGQTLNRSNELNVAPISTQLQDNAQQVKNK
jgi:hypothetical protein